MRVFATCMECQKETGHPSFEPFMVPYYEERIAYIDCSRGHRSAIMLQGQKFEVLMEEGAKALLAGFTQGACSTFASALERTYEFSLRVFMRKLGVNAEKFEAMFKEMAKMSERQFGAFMAIYLIEMGKPYAPNKKITEFRNNVIHKGLIPTPEEAKRFCSEVYSVIFEIAADLRRAMPDPVNQAVMCDLQERSKKIAPDVPRATMCGGAFFNLASCGNKVDFCEALVALEEWGRAIEGAIPVMTALHRSGGEKEGL
ncbi:hypothetical protein [Stenotrophomonas tumulicola]|uniref:DUF4145 domain-containing protein n=1 Tax=Stenotrophomonas tumulicola TaxID=1685415 RepID=A0A7W3FNA5_9GAMM|nr:hypothetical protein [Stenotrophomonas tumulicola]MBA8682719.1 hypothetical protein [Stenotrophomonas tumulicola]